MVILSSIFDILFVLNIHYLKNVISIVIEHNRDLQWWFEDIENTLLSLVVDARDCATYSGSERMFVLFYLYIIFICRFLLILREFQLMIFV